MGCLMNALEPLYGEVELLHMLNITKPNLVFCDLDKYEMVKDCLIQLDNNAAIYTFGGCKEDSEDVETLFKETNEE